MSKIDEMDALYRAVEFEADRFNFQLTDKAEKIINAKVNMGIGMHCPCHPNDPESYCISSKCKAHIELLGHCCCNLFSNGVKDVEENEV